MTKAFYQIDIERLWKASEAKMRSTKSSWTKLERTYGVAKNSLRMLKTMQHPNANHVLALLLWLNKPITDFVVTTLEDNRYGFSKKQD